MEITVYKTDEVGEQTKKVIGKFEPKGIGLPIRKRLKTLLLKSRIGILQSRIGSDKEVDWDIYQEYMDLIQISAGYSDEMLGEYPDGIIDMILSQTYLSWMPTEKK